MPGGVLTGRAVVVTGAGRGLGAAYAELAAAHGAAVVVNDVDLGEARAVAARIEAAGGRAVADGSDIATWDGAGALVAGCVDAFGAIDGLVNNAGIFRMAGPRAQDPDEFRAVVEVNLLGTAYCGLHAIRAMHGRGGSIVNVTSGAHAGSADMAAYGASKGGVASLTYCWAVDLAGSGTRVNAVSPNARTRMAEAYERHLGERARGQNMRKLPERNAPVVVYLLSDLSAAVHGQVVRIDGDELSLVCHPAVLGAGLHDPQWTVESVAAAFESDLAGQSQPLGLTRAES
jgi:NAD(P)-dependent dehydrogenase (short-subunit alcohol dehydrogenase family)